MQLHLTSVDETLPYRFVGSYEYGKCIERFTRLAQISTAEEISIYDEILNEHPEFTYFQGISTAFQSAPDLTKSDPKERAKFNDEFQKGGLAWMLALARVEYGATLSMYSGSETPFWDVVGDSQFGISEFLSILFDDSAAHIKALQQEEIFNEIISNRRTLDAWTLAYLRRLKIVKDMMLAFGDRVSSERQREILPYFRDIDKYEKGLSDAVKAATSRYVLDQSIDREFLKGGASYHILRSKLNLSNRDLLRICQAYVDRLNNKNSSTNDSRH